MANITAKQARQLGWLKPTEKKKPKGVKIPKSKPRAIAQMEMVFGHLKSREIFFIPEYRFHPSRRFRFDFCCLKYKLAVEFEGGIFLKNSGHNTPKHYTKDTEKYNMATIYGWHVLRYTALNYQHLLKDIEAFIQNNKQRQ